MKDTNSQIFVWDATLSVAKCLNEKDPTDKQAIQLVPEIRQELELLCKKYAFNIERGKGNHDYDSEDSNLTSYESEETNDTECSGSTLTDDSFSIDSDETVYEESSDEETDSIDSTYGLQFDMDSDVESQGSTLTDEDINCNSGYLHFQLRFSLIVKKRKSELLKLMKANNMLLQHARISPTRSNTVGNMLYVMKIDSRIPQGGPFTDKDEKETPIPFWLKNITLYKWQQQLLDFCKYNRSNRRITVIYDPLGNSGKSTVAYYAKCHKILNAKIIPPIMNSFLDLNQAVLSQCNKLHPELLFLDVPRAMITNKTKHNDLISFCEQCKYMVFDTRYIYKELIFSSSPEIVLFTNTKIWETQGGSLLSSDRWLILCIEENTLYRYPDYGEIVINYPEGEHPMEIKWSNLYELLLASLEKSDSEDESISQSSDCEASSE